MTTEQLEDIKYSDKSLIEMFKEAYPIIKEKE